MTLWLHSTSHPASASSGSRQSLASIRQRPNPDHTVYNSDLIIINPLKIPYFGSSGTDFSIKEKTKFLNMPCISKTQIIFCQLLNQTTVCDILKTTVLTRSLPSRIVPCTMLHPWMALHGGHPALETSCLQQMAFNWVKRNYINNTTRFIISQLPWIQKCLELHLPPVSNYIWQQFESYNVVN